MPKSNYLALAAKTHYRPIEAAIRWSGLLKFERRILVTLEQRPLPDATEFPRWPMLRLNAERILDAIAHDELPYDKAGQPQTARPLSIDDPALTVRHVDLKAWMTRYYPGERPPFLFDEIERALHPAISIDTLQILLAEREAVKAQLAEHRQAHESLRTEYEKLVKAHAGCTSRMSRSQEPGPRSESTYLNIIGGLLTLLLGQSPNGIAYSSFQTMESVVSTLLAHHEKLPGISERTLWSKLAQARRHLEAASR